MSFFTKKRLTRKKFFIWFQPTLIIYANKNGGTNFTKMKKSNFIMKTQYIHFGEIRSENLILNRNDNS